MRNFFQYIFKNLDHTIFNTSYTEKKKNSLNGMLIRLFRRYSQLRSIDLTLYLNPYIYIPLATVFKQLMFNKKT